MTASLKASDALKLLAKPTAPPAGGSRDRAQTSRLSADFDRILRKKEPKASKPEAAPPADKKATEPVDNVKPTDEAAATAQAGGPTPDEHTDADGHPRAADPATTGQPAEGADAPHPQAAQAAGHQPEEGSPESSGAPSEASAGPQPPLAQPAVVPDSRPVTIRSLNQLLLQGAKAGSLMAANARDLVRAAKPAPSGESAQQDAAATRDPSTIRESNAEQPARPPQGADDTASCLGGNQRPASHADAEASTAQTRSTSADSPATGQPNADNSIPSTTAVASTIAQPVPPTPPAAKPGVAPPAGRAVDPLAALSKSGGELGASRPLGPLADRSAALLRAEPAVPGKPPNQEQAFAAQLVRGVAAAIKQGSGAVTIRLNPEALGQLKIRIQMPGADGDRAVSARFEASNQEAKNLLEQALPGLRDSLESRGLTVGTLETTLNQPKPEAAAHVAAGMPNAEESPVRHAGAHARPGSSPPDDRAAGDPPGQGGSGTESWTGQDAPRHGQDGLAELGGHAGTEAPATGGSRIETFVHAESLDAAARSAGLIGRMGGGTVGGVTFDPGRSPGVYRTSNTDGGAARVVVDAVA